MISLVRGIEQAQVRLALPFPVDILYFGVTDYFGERLAQLLRYHLNHLR